ncbi:MAG: energy-coupling factor ABC transporter ATP-binding protein [Oscillospiraceae bacterium]|nr:energy-coupling factor ABC transporter ATP-binding protein [Oscillospiraceae bacterium]
MDYKVLELQNVTYTYEGEKFPVWELLSCDFYEGKIHAISGPSGSGKSSILYLIDGLIPHMYEGTLEGKVLFRGEDITDVLPRYRCNDIGFVMQNPESQFCTYTVEEELAFGMENLGIPVEEMERRIRETLEFVGMTGYEATNLDDLSGGQKQKIAIASVLVTKPSVLLLDEPTANLDPESRRQIFDLILRISREEKVTIIIVEHNIAEIANEVDRFIAVDGAGKIVVDCKKGDPEEKAWIAANTHDPEIPHREYREQAGEPILEIKGLHFAYPIPGKKHEKGKSVIRDLNMTLYSQEFLAIVGENGVGKSTLMKLLFKVNQPDSGEIRIYGKPISSYRTKQLYHKMGLVFQNPENQFVTNTVFDEMMFSLKRVAISNEEKEDRINKMLEKFHLEHEKEKSPFALSQGQKRRLSVASMLLTNQQVLFLDEPTYGQDFENRQELMKDMQELVEKGITIVMITHDLALVRQYATRVVRIENGTVTKDLPTAEYFAK